MLLEEANSRLKKPITIDQLNAIHIIYSLLGLEKDDFCKIVDAVGVEVLAKNKNAYDRLDKAERELAKKERYLAAKKKLAEIEEERKWLEVTVNSYSPF